jgi:arginase
MSSTAPSCPACSSAGSGSAVTQIEDCLAAVCATADVKAACIACTWLPDRISDQTTRETITGLASALGADLAWQATGESFED